MVDEADEEYEIVPANPLRRLEQRMAKVEQGASPTEVRRLIEEIVELIKGNQRVLDDTLKANAELRDEVAKLPGRMDALISRLTEFVDMLKSAGTEEPAAAPALDPKAFAGVEGRLAELGELQRKGLEIEQAMLASLSVIDKRLKRLYIELAAGREQAQQPYPGEQL
ncbi:MAG TPA: hypothetical protein VJB16_05320 [archaeon]|nr:hypothetical protein [archaeon]